ncbi:MAG: choice-of-anchor D domain-containing protein [Ignavibacteria bacterium]|nr:choice-of-anchor D domain-containing protein [Ignavibacteria bacterium]
MLVFLFCSPTLYAQKISALIYADKNQKNADTIDFGVVLYEDNITSKNTVTTRTIYIENTGEVPLAIPSILAPYFSAGARVINSFEHLEFSNSGNNPKTILPGATDSLFLSYKPERDTTTTNSPIGIRVATVLIRPCPLINGICDAIDTIGLPIRREFIAKVFKSRYPLSVVKPRILFDSVYVNSFGSLQSRIPFKNISRDRITATSQEFRVLGNTLPNEFVFEPSPFTSVNSNDTLPFFVRYIPKNRGVDSASIFIRYAPGRNDVQDSTSVRIYGFGAQQEVRIIDVQADLPGTTFVRDTIFLRDVPVGSDNTITIKFANTGNTNFGIVSQKIEGDNQFTLIKPLSAVKDLRPNEQDSAKITFNPRLETDLGLYEAQFIIQNNIHTRIPTSPDSVKRRIITLRARALTPIMSIVGTQQDTMRIGTFKLPFNKSCGLKYVDDTVLIQNKGNAELRIQTPILTGKINTKFSLQNAQADTIPKQNDRALIVRFYPEQLGADTAYIEIQSNDPFRRKKILTLIGTVAPPDTIQVNAPVFTAVDGVVVRVPLRCPSTAISQATKVRLNIVLDESVLAFVRADAIGASAGGKIFPQTLQDGVVSLQIEAPLGGTFVPNDTLCLLALKTYFGKLDSSPIVLTSPQIGNADCDELFVPRQIAGSFRLDSACLYAFNHINSSSARFGIRTISPLPTKAHSAVVIELAFPSRAKVSIYSATGVLMKEVIHNNLSEGLHTFNFDASDLPQGVYFCELQAGVFLQLRSFIVGQ